MPATCRAWRLLGVRHPCDVAFLDIVGRALAAYHAPPPCARSNRHYGAVHALERSRQDTRRLRGRSWRRTFDACQERPPA